jgi:hypothetical protein
MSGSPIKDTGNACSPPWYWIRLAWICPASIAASSPSLAGAAQVGEEVGAVAELAGLEPSLQRAQDVLARMQPFAVRPRPEVHVPVLARSLPLLVAIVQPAAVFAGCRQSGEAPPRGRLVEALAGPFHHDQDPARHQGRRGQVQHAAQGSHVVQRGAGDDGVGWPRRQVILEPDLASAISGWP